MQTVDKFVEDTNKSGKNEQITISVPSQALKRQLAKDIAIKYRDSANIFTEFKKGSDQFIIKRWAKRNNAGGAATSGSKPNPEDPAKSTTATTATSTTTEDSTTTSVIIRFSQLFRLQQQPPHNSQSIQSLKR